MAADRQLPGHYYIEFGCIGHGRVPVDKIIMGEFYKCKQDAHTLALFQSAKEQSSHHQEEDENDFIMVLRISSEKGVSQGPINVTKEYYEHVTGNKALSIEKYYDICDKQPTYDVVGARIIEL